LNIIPWLNNTLGKSICADL